MIRSCSESPGYRWRLTMSRDGGAAILAWLLMNPSTAGKDTDDATTLAIQRFMVTLDAHSSIIVNRYAYRTPDPDVLAARHADGIDVVGEHNDAHIAMACMAADKVIVGWGNTERWQKQRSAQVMDLLRKYAWGKCYSLRINKSGDPGHPLYLSPKTALKPFLLP